MSATPAASASSRVVVLKSLGEYESYRAKAAAAGSPLVLLFTAAWHQQPCQQMVTVCETLAKQFNNTLFAQVDAEEVSDVTEQFPTVESVPSTVLIKNGTVVGSVNGANAVELTSLVTQHSRAEASAAVASTASTAAAPASTESKEELNARLAKLVRASPVMAFIKGTVEAPRCGFTKQLLAQLKETGVDFGTFDILSDNAVREGLKAFSNWPTYPQVYVEGELIGGLDVVKELIASGEFQGMVPAGHLKKNAEEALNERLKALIAQNRVMLFMKGTPEAPQCGFSNKAVAMLKSVGCEDFGHFNIFSDSEVREGLKAYSNWPTYPQLYIDNELVGGLDVMQELNENGELKDMLNAPPPLEAK